MSEPRRCPQCDAEIPPNSPAGLCPRCLLKASADSQSAGAAEPGPTKLTPPASGFVPPTVEELIPLFPQLEILGLLGKGGMGAVYKARQPGLDRLVAVKILPPEISHDPAFAERFQREARALARLSHPHIVSVYDFGVVGQAFQPDALVATGQAGKPDLRDGLCYIVMEFVDGANLRQAIQAGKLAAVEALAIVPQICEALQFAHDEGIVHRDIKPENILIDKRGRVKIADFGLAKLLGQDASDHSLTATHQVMGTLRYMAPEQMQGSREVDHRADIYSLGVVFYELLTGELPMGRFAPPSKRVQVDVRLDEIVLRALEQQPEQRYQQANELKSAVTSFSAVADQAPMTPGDQYRDQSRDGTIRVHKLLDVTETRNRRLHQQATAIGIFSLLIAFCLGLASTAKSLTDYRSILFCACALAVLAGIALMVYSSRVKRRLCWKVNYKGHEIVFDGGRAFAERLYLDDGLVRQGGFGVKMEIRTTIKAGDGIGDEIVVWYDARILSCRCRIDVEENSWREQTGENARTNQVSLPQTGHQPLVEIRGENTVTGPVPMPKLVQGPADCLLLAAGIAFVTACGVAVWLLAVPAYSSNQFTNSMIRGNLIGMSVALATYSLFAGGASLMLRRLQARFFVLLVAVIVGLFFPAVCALNVVMEFRNIPVWPVVIPLWLGIPAALWVVVTLFRDDVRGAFDAAELRRLRDFSTPPQQTPSIASEPRFSRFAIAGAVWAIFGLLTVIPVLYFIGLNRVWNGTALPTDVIHSEPPLVFSIFMGALLVIGAGAPIGTTIYGGIAIGHIKRSGGQIIGLPLAVADVIFFPLLVLGSIIIGLTALAWAGLAPHSNEVAIYSSVSFGVLIALVVCFMVSRAAWRAISRQEKQTVEKPGPDSSLRVDQPSDATKTEATDAQESLPYLLGWLVYWLLRERWFVAIVQTLTALIYAACLIAVFSFQSTSTQTPNGSLTKFQVGQPSAWLTLEASQSGQHAGFEFLTLTHVLALFGLASLAVYRWLERRHFGKAHSMKLHYFLWGMFLAGAVGLGLFFLSGADRQGLIHAIVAPKSELPPLGTITSGIGAEFTVPAGQVATFEIVTRRDNETVAIPLHCAYLMASPDKPEAGLFRWTPIAKENVEGSHWNYRIELRTAGGGGGHSEATLLPDELNVTVGARGYSLGQLEPNEEVVHWGTIDANNLPANGLIGLRVTVVTHGLKLSGSGIAHIDWKKAQVMQSTTRRKLPSVTP